MSKAFEALERAIWRALCMDRYKARPSNPGKPGELISNMPKEDREQLKDLTSDEVANIRKDALF